ncbi:MAG: hypothetical protein JNM07_10985 [Phycisphaerae bacterium]|nr:hypothetical protein [Phycisphaerae bacterium]
MLDHFTNSFELLSVAITQRAKDCADAKSRSLHDELVSGLALLAGLAQTLEHLHTVLRELVDAYADTIDQVPIRIGEAGRGRKPADAEPTLNGHHVRAVGIRDRMYEIIERVEHAGVEVKLALASVETHFSWHVVGRTTALFAKAILHAFDPTHSAGLFVEGVETLADVALARRKARRTTDRFLLREEEYRSNLYRVGWMAQMQLIGLRRMQEWLQRQTGPTTLSADEVFEAWDNQIAVAWKRFFGGAPA